MLLLPLLLLLRCVVHAVLLGMTLTVGVEVTGGDSQRRDSLVTATRILDTPVLLLLQWLLLLLLVREEVVSDPSPICRQQAALP